jgi:hypothetical protein
MEYNEKVKYLDIVILNIEKTEMFSINDILSKKTNLSNTDKNNIELDLISFGGANKYGLFELLNPKNTNTRWLKLTEKGEELKVFKKGFEKFLKKENKKPWYNENWIGYLIAFIVFLFTVYQHFENRTLSNQVYVVNKKNDSLNIQIETYKNQFFELKEKIEKNKEQGK